MCCNIRKIQNIWRYGNLLKEFNVNFIFVNQIFLNNEDEIIKNDER